MANNLLQYNYTGLRKIISGGQCGADKGGLEGARRSGVATGGTAPKGWRTLNGPDLDLIAFGLKEDTSISYVPRTKANVCDSDGTLIISSRTESAGTVLTLRFCRQNNKPHMMIHPNEHQTRFEEVCKWVEDNQIYTLNVAGNRDYAEHKGVHGDAARNIITSLCERLAEK